MSTLRPGFSRYNGPLTTSRAGTAPPPVFFGRMLLELGAVGEGCPGGYRGFRGCGGFMVFFVVVGLNWTSGIVALQQIVEPIVTGLGYALVEIERSAGGLLR